MHIGGLRGWLSRVGGALAAIAIWSAAGCAPQGPRVFPPAPLVESTDAAGEARSYDLNGDGSPDFAEHLTGGRVVEIAWLGGDGRRVRLAEARAGAVPHLLIILDSVPYDVVRDAWNAGRLRYFPPPSRVISPFPVMTDPALADFFGVDPCAGVESVHYDGTRLVEGYDAYLSAENAPWLRFTDFHLSNAAHACAYLWPRDWFESELGEIQRRFESRHQTGSNGADDFVGYCVGTSALGSKRGRDGHQYALIEIDRFCQQVVHDLAGAVNITLISDHGHNLVPSRRLRLAEHLERCGYRVGKELSDPQDVVLPEFGLVSCAALHTQSAARVARDCAGFAGVELACYVSHSPSPGGDSEHSCDSDEIVVVSRDGEATITRQGERYRYEPLRGDPLKLSSTLADLRATGKLDESGYVSDASLFAATETAEFPDPLDRLWRAFHGQFKSTPDVFLSLEDGALIGSAGLMKWLDMQSVHGSLRLSGSSGFVLTTLGDVPRVIRMRDLRARIRSAAPHGGSEK